MGEAEFEAISYADRTPTVLVRSSGALVAVNPAAKAMFGWASGEDLSEAGGSSLMSFLRRCSGSREGYFTRARLPLVSGALREFRCDGALLHLAGQNSSGLVVLRLRDLPQDVRSFSILSAKIDELDHEIRRRRKVETKLRKALRDKEILLRELHHRVSNNLQAVSSLFRMAATQEKDPATKAKLLEALTRIGAIATVQRLLYQDKEVGSIDLGELVRDISIAVSAAYGATQIQLYHDVSPATISLDIAMPIGLLVNELLTNAYKYAFLDRPAGRIEIESRSSDEELVIAVHDDGVGFEINEGQRAGLGLKLVKNLTQQINGAFRLETAPGAGTYARVVVPKFLASSSS